MKKESISVKVIASKHQPKERILMMTTLSQNTLHFNRSIKLSSNGGALSSDTGEMIFREFDEKISFSQTIAKHLQLKDERTYCIHENEQLLRQKIYQVQLFVYSSVFLSAWRIIYYIRKWRHPAYPFSIFIN